MYRCIIRYFTNSKPTRCTRNSRFLTGHDSLKRIIICNDYNGACRRICVQIIACNGLIQMSPHIIIIALLPCGSYSRVRSAHKGRTIPTNMIIIYKYNITYYYKIGFIIIIPLNRTMPHRRRLRLPPRVLQGTCVPQYGDDRTRVPLL